MRKKKAVKKAAKKAVKKAAEMSEEKITAISFAVTLAIIGVFILISNIHVGPQAKQLSVYVTAELKDPANIRQPMGIAVSGGRVYIASVDTNEVLVTGLTDKGWKIEKKIGSYGVKPGQFNQPSGIALDAAGNLYAADAHNGRIQKFSADGKFIMEINMAKTGFWRPRALAVAKDGTIYLSNTGKWNVYRFTAEGKMLGEKVSFPGEVFGISADSSDRIYVASLGSRSVEVFTRDFVPVKKIKMPSFIPSKGLAPMTAIDAKDRLYAVSELEKCVYVYDTNDPKFKLLGAIKKDKAGKPLFEKPLAVAVDAGGFVYVSERSSGKVVRLKVDY